MTVPVRVGILGLGSIGKTHARSLAEIGDGVELVAATSASPELLAELGFPDVRVTDFDGLVTAADVDVVVIATPSDLHGEHALAALRNGKHLVVEKPLATNLDEAKQIVRLAAESGLFVSVIAQRRLEPQHVALKSLLSAGTLGQVILGEAFVHWFRDEAYYESAPWRAQAPGGGSLMNQALHSVDLLDWLVGPVETVAAHTATLGHSIEAEDTSVSSLRFTSGALGLIVSSTATPPGEAAKLVIHTTRGVVELTQAEITRWELPGVDKPEVVVEAMSGANDPSAIGISGHVEQWRDILAAMRERRDPAVTVIDGFRSVALIDAIYESSRTGLRVEVSPAE